MYLATSLNSCLIQMQEIPLILRILQNMCPAHTVAIAMSGVRNFKSLAHD